MRIGTLRRRVTIQTFEPTFDEFHQPVKDWVDYTTVWGSVENLTGREYFQAQQVETNTVDTRITIRWRDDITAHMRALANGKTYDIQAVLDKEGRERQLELMCREVIM